MISATWKVSQPSCFFHFPTRDLLNSSRRFFICSSSRLNMLFVFGNLFFDVKLVIYVPYFFIRMVYNWTSWDCPRNYKKSKRMCLHVTYILLLQLILTSNCWFYLTNLTHRCSYSWFFCPCCTKPPEINGHMDRLFLNNFCFISVIKRWGPLIHTPFEWILSSNSLKHLK